jgi:hypothetical protein
VKNSTPWNSFDEMEQYNSLFPLLPDYVAHYTLGGKFFPQVGLPNKESLDLANDILTVFICNQLGISFAYAKKRYLKEISSSRWLGLTERIDYIYQLGQNCLGSYVSFGLDLPFKDDSLQDLSMQFFFRNLVALDAAKRLTELGYLCEAAAILRSALEQFSFSAKLWEMDGSVDLATLRPRYSLNYLKAIVPACGRLYGVLSTYTHFEYDYHTHFFARSPKAVFTVQRGPVLRAYATQLLFLTMVCVSRYVLYAAAKQFEKVPTSVKELSSFIERANKFSDDVCCILKQDMVLAQFDLLLQDLASQKI